LIGPSHMGYFNEGLASTSDDEISPERIATRYSPSRRPLQPSKNTPSVGLNRGSSNGSLGNGPSTPKTTHRRPQPHTEPAPQPRPPVFLSYSPPPSAQRDRRTKPRTPPRLSSSTRRMKTQRTTEREMDENHAPTLNQSRIPLSVVDTKGIYLHIN
jgi:hypothetical protein